MQTPRTNRLGGTTAFGSLLCSVGGLFLLLATPTVVDYFVRPESMSTVLGVHISFSLTVLSRLLVVVTGILVLRRRAASRAAAVVAVGVIVLSGGTDAVVIRGLSDVTVYQLAGSFIALGLLLAPLVLTLIYMRRPDVRAEFGFGDGQAVLDA